MDILQYSALKEQTDVCACASTVLPGMISTIGSAYLRSAQAAWDTYRECICRYPGCTAYWYQGIPQPPSNVNTTVGASNSLRVCDNNSNGLFNCGACCLWTVPTGASFLRFQAWGSGGMAGTGCCCGGGPFGTTGAYASVIMPAVAGCQYTLCAGCAALCCNSQSSGPWKNSGSLVLGPGLCCFCADGGCGSLCTWVCCIHGHTSNCATSINSWVGTFNNGLGICNSGGDYCGASTCTYGSIPFLWAGEYLCGNGTGYYGCTIDFAAGYCVTGLAGMYRCFCNSQPNYGCQTHPPIYGFDTVTQCATSYVSILCGYNYISSLNYPGAGAWLNNSCGGSTAVYGGPGKMGMICVTWW